MQAAKAKGGGALRGVLMVLDMFNKRIANDRQPYTLQDFVEWSGPARGMQQWEVARPFRIMPEAVGLLDRIVYRGDT